MSEKRKIKFRAKMKGDQAEIKAILTHPMLTGRTKNKETGEPIPSHFVEEVLIESNGKTLLTCNWGGSISKNPYLSFKFPGKKGDTVTFKWKDNQGESGEAETKIK